MLFSQRDRIVIEIDGKQHYSDGDISSPIKYAEMVKAQREMCLQGYDVYRLGGKEFCGSDQGKQEVRPFFISLFKKYTVKSTET